MSTPAESTAPVGTGAEASTESGYAAKVTQTYDTDVVVVGSGVSGLAAGVKCAESGLKAIMIETNSYRGGIGPEGMCAINSSISKAAGVEVDMSELLAHDNEFFNFRLNTFFWLDMYRNSADVIDWLIDNGVEFTGQVDNYKNIGR